MARREEEEVGAALDRPKLELENTIGKHVHAVHDWLVVHAHLGLKLEKCVPLELFSFAVNLDCIKIYLLCVNNLLY